MNIKESLFRRVLGRDYEKLPPALQTMHDTGAGLRGEGRADVIRGSSLMAKLAGALFRLPPAKRNEPVWFDFVPETDKDGEAWRRDFNGHILETRHRPRGKRPKQVLEKLGPLTLVLTVAFERGGIAYRLTGLRFLGLPIPRFLGPRVEARETEEQGYFVFESTVTLPVGGRLIRYRGWLTPRPLEVETKRRPPSQEVLDTGDESKARPPSYSARKVFVPRAPRTVPMEEKAPAEEERDADIEPEPAREEAGRSQPRTEVRR